jgi:hypothetical protein
MRLALTQGISFTTGYYWHYDDETRAFARRFFERHKSMPTMTQAGVYSAVLRYLKAVAKVGTLESDAVMAEMKKSKVNDFFGRGGYIRTDGRMVHDMYLVEVKTPSESKEPLGHCESQAGYPGRRSCGAAGEEFPSLSGKAVGKIHRSNSAQSAGAETPRITGCPAGTCHRARRRRDPVAGHDAFPQSSFASMPRLTPGRAIKALYQRST